MTSNSNAVVYKNDYKQFDEGFWSETNIPKCGNYQNNNIIEKLKEITNIVTSRWKAFININRIEKFSTQYCNLGPIPYMPLNAYQYMGYAHCRLCEKKENGDATIIITVKDKKINFPSGYIHYLEHHGVVPSKEFEDIITEIDIHNYNDILDIYESAEAIKFLNILSIKSLLEMQ